VGPDGDRLRGRADVTVTHDPVAASYADRVGGKRLYLQFAGVNQVADVWANGTYLGQHEGGYSRFRFDATAALVPGGNNVIAVKVTNARDTDIAPSSADCTFQGGIYRNVSLWAVDDLHVRMTDYAGPGVHLRQGDVSPASATVTVTTKLGNDSTTTRWVVVRGSSRTSAGPSSRTRAAPRGPSPRPPARRSSRPSRSATRTCGTLG
jgi:beta-galactosidase